MLTITPLTLGYNGQFVLRFSGLALEQGAQCLLTGPSGSGKTTLLYAIAGLIPVMGGTITVNGTDITAARESRRDRFRGRHIGMVFQTLHLVKSLTVLENLLLPAYAAGLRQHRAEALDMLGRLGIADKRNALPDQLSQGQAQRVAIARAMLHRPDIVLADEPTSSLDDASCARVMQLLRELAREHNATLLISTHDSRVKAQFGQVIALGETP